MKIPFLSPLVRTVARHGLSIAAGALIAKGWIAQGHLDTAADCIGEYSGAVALGLLSMGWSYLEKRWFAKSIAKVQSTFNLAPTGHLIDLVTAAKAKGEQ